MPDQSGQKKRFWQFNGSRTQPDQPDQQPSKQKASKQKDPSTQPPTEMDMSQNSLSSHSMHNAELDHEPDSQPAEEEVILLTEGGVGGPFKFSDGWTVINDSLDESFTPESDPDTPGLLHSVEDVILTRTYLKIVGGSEEVGASKGPQHSKGLGHSESSEQSEAMSVAVRPAQKKLLKGSAISVSPAGTSAADSSHTGAKQRGVHCLIWPPFEHQHFHEQITASMSDICTRNIDVVVDVKLQAIAPIGPLWDSV